MLITQSLITYDQQKLKKTVSHDSVKANLKAETDGAICLSDTANGRTKKKIFSENKTYC